MCSRSCRPPPTSFTILCHCRCRCRNETSVSSCATHWPPFTHTHTQTHRRSVQLMNYMALGAHPRDVCMCVCVCRQLDKAAFCVPRVRAGRYRRYSPSLLWLAAHVRDGPNGRGAPSVRVYITYIICVCVPACTNLIIHNVNECALLDAGLVYTTRTFPTHIHKKINKRTCASRRSSECARGGLPIEVVSLACACVRRNSQCIIRFSTSLLVFETLRVFFPCAEVQQPASSSIVPKRMARVTREVFVCVCVISNCAHICAAALGGSGGGSRRYEEDMCVSCTRANAISPSFTARTTQVVWDALSRSHARHPLAQAFNADRSGPVCSTQTYFVQSFCNAALAGPDYNVIFQHQHQNECALFGHAQFIIINNALIALMYICPGCLLR